MARSDVLVSVDWAQSNLDAPGVVFVEVVLCKAGAQRGCALRNKLLVKLSEALGELVVVAFVFVVSHGCSL